MLSIPLCELAPLVWPHLVGCRVGRWPPGPHPVVAPGGRLPLHLHLGVPGVVGVAQPLPGVLGLVVGLLLLERVLGVGLLLLLLPLPGVGGVCVALVVDVASSFRLRLLPLGVGPVLGRTLDFFATLVVRQSPLAVAFRQLPRAVLPLTWCPLAPGIILIYPDDKTRSCCL